MLIFKVKFSAILILFFCMVSLTSVSSYIEPSTKIAFENTIRLSKSKLHLTGVDRRKEWGKEVYAIAHYSETSVGKELSAEKKLDQFINANSPKAIVLKGVNTKIPARGIRWAWNKGLKDVGYTNNQTRKDFVNAFNKSFAKGDEIIFDSTTQISLKVYLNSKLLGEWDDPLLQKAIWEICLNENSDLVDRKNLVSLEFNVNPQ